MLILQGMEENYDFVRPSFSVGENRELGTNQSVFRQAVALLFKFGKEGNKGLDWPVCAEFQYPNSIEIS